MASPERQTSHEADPSPPPRPRPPSITQSPADETSAITASLTVRRLRRGSIRHVFSRKTAKEKARNEDGEPDGRDSEAEEDEDESVLRAVVEEGERMKAEMPEAVEVLKGGKKVDLEDEQGGEVRQEFVWDVLFENQRGVYLLGKAYFSSRTLLPIDPSAFTVPSHTLPSASSFAISAPDGTTKFQRKRTKPSKNTRDPKDRTIRTLYTPETYQTPSPAWMWITPWMVNMRNGTDEGGWRYNAWFKKGGWGSHAGPAGWGGWVRRREWVRLRAVMPKGKELEAPGVREDEVVDTTKGLGEVTSSAHVQDNVDSVLKAMGRMPLDRQKVDTWRRWLDDGDERSFKRIQRLLDTEGARDQLLRSVTHHTTVTTLLHLFKQHDLSMPIPTAPSPESPPIPSPDSPPPDPRDKPSTSPTPDTDD